MIDLHNHLLPGIDDGSPDIETSLQLARMAVAEGITHLVCTPHIHLGRWDNTPITIAAALRDFRAVLAREKIDLKVAAAAEVRFDIEIMQGVLRREIPFVGKWEGENVLLLEFPHGDIPFGAEKLVQWLRERNIRPMIAHPERNRAVMRTPARLRPLLDAGCLVQLTADAVAGRFGQPAQAIAHDLLAAGKVTVLASDAHNVDKRPPSLRAGVEAAAGVLGDEARAERLVRDVPWQLAESRFAG